MKQPLLMVLVVALALSSSGQDSRKRRRSFYDDIQDATHASHVITYKQVGDRALKMHIFMPEGFNKTDRRVAYVIFHGGGWSGGTPKRVFPLAAHAAANGMVGIAVQYRLINRLTHTTPFESVKDARSAMRYLKANAPNMGIDPEKIVASGGSAGAHLALGTALFDGIDEESDNTAISPNPAALVLRSPVLDTSLKGFGNEKCGENWESISPFHRISKSMPSAIIFQGATDTTTKLERAKLFQEKMIFNGVRCEMIINESGGHGYYVYDRAAYDYMFLKENDFLKSLELLK